MPASIAKISSKHKYSENPFLVDEASQRGEATPVAENDHDADFFNNAQVVPYGGAAPDGFIKLYTGQLKVWFDLTRTGQRVLVALLLTMQKRAIKKGEVELTPVTIETLSGLGGTATYRGVNELIKQRLIARYALGPHHYFINHNYVFNGDRDAFLREHRLKHLRVPGPE